VLLLLLMLVIRGICEREKTCVLKELETSVGWVFLGLDTEQAQVLLEVLRKRGGRQRVLRV
jgi:hypothetical protein